MSNVLDKPWWKSQTIQIFFQSIHVKYFAVIDNNPPPSNSDKMNLLNQMLESAKLKDTELRLEKDIMKEDKGKMENSGENGLEEHVSGTRHEVSGWVC